MVKRAFSIILSLAMIILLCNDAVSLQTVFGKSSDTYTPAYLVKDINPGFDTENELGSDPRSFITLNGILYFIAIDKEHGQVLWKSDGTSEGTLFFKDSFPEPGDTEFQGLTVIGNFFYFFVRNDYNLWQLWKSDGSESGTVCIKDELYLQVDYVLDPQYIFSPRSFNENLFFIAGTDDSVFSLWRSDGTSSGTLPIKEVIPYDNPFSYSSLLTVVDNTLYFEVNDPGGVSLWKSDGTTEGTNLIYSRTHSYNIRSMVDYNSELLFLMSSSWNGSTFLMKSDGTTTGTVEIKSFAANESGGLYNAGTKVFFFLEINTDTAMETWTSDGTSKNTKRLIQMNGDLDYDPHVLAQLKDIVFFAIHKEPGLVPTSKLYRSNGTTAGTYILNDNFFPISANVLGEKVLFLEERDNPNLWISDGTREGTELVKSFTVSANDLIFGKNQTLDMAILGDSVLFGYDAGAQGVELWKSDGTNPGTQLLKNIYSVYPLVSYPRAFTAFDGTLYFRASTKAEGLELWKSDGTEGTTAMVKDILPGLGDSDCGTDYMAALNSDLFFFARTSYDNCGLWKYNNSISTATLITEVITSNDVAFDNSLIETKEGVFFTLDNNSLWRSNGAPENTLLVKQIDCSPYLCGRIRNLTEVNGMLYFSIGRYFLDSQNQSILVDEEFWKSGGFETNTTLISRFHGGYVQKIVGLGDIVYFFFSGDLFDSSNSGLWRSDRTEAGTYLLAPFLSIDQIISDEAGGRLFIAGRTYSEGTELWTSDGAITGTVLVKDIYPGTGSSQPESMAMIAGKLLFFADDGTHGTELWVSDGTSDGTHMVKDISPGSERTYPYGMTSEGLDGWALFSANDGQTGYELWQSNGTEQGTMLVQDIAPGILNSTPSEITASGDKVFFTADDYVNGYELWAMDKTAITTPRVDDLHLFTQTNTPISSILPAIDPSGNPLTYTLVTNGGLGTATIDNPVTGDFTYTPNTDITGVDSITFQVTNGAQTSTIATITIDINKGFFILPFMLTP